ncbi:hypothetical protein HAX54_037517, partial [Datura stramonium]|nr:hypothetical protein [Datura stramonium]
MENLGQPDLPLGEELKKAQRVVAVRQAEEARLVKAARMAEAVFVAALLKRNKQHPPCHCG